MVPSFSQATGSLKILLYCQSLPAGQGGIPCPAATAALEAATPAGLIPKLTCGFTLLIRACTSLTIRFTLALRQSFLPKLSGLYISY